MSEYEFWIYKDQTGFAFYPQFSFRDPNMLATAKSTSPVAPVATESRDWMKASTPELQSGSEDESDVLDAKTKERRRRKQVKREERQRREEAERRSREEAEVRAREEAEHAKAEAEQKAREQAEREQAEKDGRRCSGGLQRLQRGRGRWRRKHQRNEQGRSRRQVWLERPGKQL